MAAVSRRILQTGSQNLAKFAMENCGPYSLMAFVAHMHCAQSHKELEGIGLHISAKSSFAK